MAADNEAESRNYGEKIKYEKNFRGPGGDRSCTDVLCLLIFVVFLGGWGFIGHYAYTKGDLNRVLLPTDSDGLMCGVDSDVLNKPFLMFFDLQKCIDPLVAINGCQTPQVCVSKCPSDRFVFDIATCNNANLATLKSQLVCNQKVNKELVTKCEDIETLINADKCVRWYLKSESLSRRCIPFSWSQADLADINAYISNETKLEEAINNIRSLANINGEGQKVVSDITSTWIPIAVALVMAMFCCLIVIAMMRWLAAPLLWLSIIGVIGLLSLSVYFTQLQYRYYLANPKIRQETITNLSALANSYLHSKNFWLVLLIAASFLLVVLLLVVLILRKRILIAIALVKEGSKAVSSTYSTVFFPIIPWILQVAVIGFAITVLLLLISVGESKYAVTGLANDTNCICSGEAVLYKEKSSCNPKIFNDNCRNTGTSRILSFLRQGVSSPCSTAACHFMFIEQPGIVPYFHAANVLGFFWVVFFISAFGEMVLAGTFATWYWSFKKSSVPFFTLTRSLARTVRYHLGTLAFGSLILAICRIIRVILEYISTKLKTYDNAVTRAILCCLKCFFWALENFLRFLNRNSYIMCAVHGKNFCTSSKDAFNLLMRNFLRVYTLDKVTCFLFFMSKLLVTLGMGAVTFFYLSSDVNQIRLNYIFVPAIVVMIGTYLISTVFFTVYSMAVDTLFLCFLEDCERNDGSAEKPYFMSKSLMRILGKRNKNDVSREHFA